MSLHETSQTGDLNGEEDLRRENEIMKIKLQAEFGAVFSENEQEMPADIEHQFLENVYQFEKAWEKQDIVAVSKMLNNQPFIPFEDLEQQHIEGKLDEVLQLYKDAGIDVDFEFEYPDETRYRFLTEELPMHQTVLVNMPGMRLGFQYEEFHPNIAGDLEKLVRKFIGSWFERDWESCAACLSARLVMETGLVMSADDVKYRIKNMFECFEAFENYQYEIHESSYDRQESKEHIPEFVLGYSEGNIEWTARVDAKESIAIHGPFKIYLEATPDDWSIMYFVMPGWNWVDE